MRPLLFVLLLGVALAGLPEEVIPAVAGLPNATFFVTQMPVLNERNDGAASNVAVSIVSPLSKTP